MGLLVGKRIFSIVALCMMVGLLLLPVVVALPSLAIGEETHAGDAAKKDGDKVEKGRDVYYKTEGIVSGAPAPKTTDGVKDYPRYNFESRVLLWFANQQHLYYGSFVLAVPIFCMIIEFMGVVTKDKALAKVGSTKFANQRRQTFNVGFGFRVLFSDRFAMRVDVRDHIFSYDLLGVRQNTQNLELTTGFAYYF